MGLVLMLAGLALALVASVISIVIVVAAFRKDVAHGFLTLCVPFYIVFFAFARYDHPRKWAVVGVWIAAILLAGGLLTAGGCTSLVSLVSDKEEAASTSPAEPTDIHKLKKDIPAFPDLPPIKKPPEGVAEPAATADKPGDASVD